MSNTHPVVSTKYDPTDDITLGVLIVMAVASCAGVTPTKLSPLQHSVDVDALESLVRSIETTSEIAFTYEGYEIAITGDGTVRVRE